MNEKNLPRYRIPPRISVKYCSVLRTLKLFHQPLGRSRAFFIWFFFFDSGFVACLSLTLTVFLLFLVGRRIGGKRNFNNRVRDEFCMWRIEYLRAVSASTRQSCQLRRKLNCTLRMIFVLKLICVFSELSSSLRFIAYLERKPWSRFLLLLVLLFYLFFTNIYLLSSYWWVVHVVHQIEIPDLRSDILYGFFKSIGQYRHNANLFEWNYISVVYKKKVEFFCIHINHKSLFLLQVSHEKSNFYISNHVS